MRSYCGCDQGRCGWSHGAAVATVVVDVASGQGCVGERCVGHGSQDCGQGSCCGDCSRRVAQPELSGVVAAAELADTVISSYFSPMKHLPMKKKMDADEKLDANE